MITPGTPLAGAYTIHGKKTIDYTGVVAHVDIPHEGAPEYILTTIRFHGGREVSYVTDANGHSVDTGMLPTSCPTTRTLTPVH